jgi:hypothetical protein
LKSPNSQLSFPTTFLQLFPLRIRCSLGVAYFHCYFPFPFTFTLATSCLYLHIPPYLKSGCSLTPSGRPPLTSRSIYWCRRRPIS